MEASVSRRSPGGAGDPPSPRLRRACELGSAINLAPHLHGLLLDGVDDDRGLFHRLPAPTDDDVADVIERVVRQVTKALRRRGHPLVVGP